MAKKKSPGSLAAKVKAAVGKRKTDETTYGRIDLPGGIKNGIAQLVTVTFDTYKKGDNEGEFYCRMAGVVVEPKENATGIPVKGLQTSQMYALCETTNGKGEQVSLEDNVATVLNEFRKLGLDTSEYDDSDIEQMGSDLQDAQPYFRFSTTDRYDRNDIVNGKVKEGAAPSGAWENWHGGKGLEEYEPEEDEEVEEEGEEEEEEEEPRPKKKTAKPKSGPAPTKKTKKKKAAPKEPTLEELAEQADNGDEDAQASITEKADEAGIDTDEYEDWAAVVAAINESGEEPEYEDAEDEEDEEEAEEITPAKGEFYVYDGSECEVTAVVKNKKTCTLKSVETDEVLKGIPWSDLSYE